MTSVQKAVFPGMLVGILFVIFFTGLLAAPHVVLAANPAANAQLKASQDQDPKLTVQPTAAAKSTKTKNSSTKNSNSAKTAANCSLGPGFPDAVKQWCGLIQQYAKKYSLDPDLVASVMLQESGGNPNAYSNSGAVGLLQVMPRDGLAAGFQCVSGPCFASRPTTDELYDPEYNISYGTRMLAGLIQKYGDVREALKAYGPMDIGYRYADIVLSLFDKYNQ
jgi:soluble lytic murein transglycosylase-like protein